MSHTFIVAELGSIAEGDLATMLRQIDAAADAGCDAVKPQWLSSAARLVERRQAQDYAGAYANLVYPESFLAVMREHAKDAGMQFWCSAYLREDVWPLAPYVDGFKVSSFEAADEALLQTIFATGKPALVSLGMGGEIPEWHLRPTDRLRYLHCVSAYPAPLDACNLRVLSAARRVCPDGFSDHTAHVLTGAFAVCAGARVIEFHLRLHDSNPNNPDFACALPPDLAKQYCLYVRQAEAMMGDGVKKPQPCEADMARFKVKA